MDGNDTAPQTCVCIEGPGVAIEATAWDQLRRVAGLRGTTRTVGMPDLHPGPGLPIGMATATVGTVHPELVGADAGCGVTAVIATRQLAAAKLLRRIAQATDDPEPLGVEPIDALVAAWHGGPVGLAALPGIDPAFADWVASVPWSAAHGPSAPLPEALADPRWGEALGTIGGGNHFAELARVDRVDEPGALAGLERGAPVVLAHSGSRGLGYALMQRHLGRTLDDPSEIAAYLGELAGCCRFAQANRACLVWRLLGAIGAARIDRCAGAIDLIHNDVTGQDGRTSPGEPTGWLHRKGAAPAERGALTLTLGSRGAASWILRGTGDAAHLCSVAHGAGRRITRTDAKSKLSHRYRRSELDRTALGGHVLCDDHDLLWEEHPDVYKPIEPVVDALVAAGVATRVASLVPVVTVKR
jgi:release factor H-coupled RctB family protein